MIPIVTIVMMLLLVAPAQERRYAGYDPTRDPAKDLEAAIEQAKKDNKRILLVVGGEWCGWCHTLEKYLKSNTTVKTAWDTSFVSFKVNWSTENRNEAFLSKYPRLNGYPHFFVLEKDGTFLHAQDTGVLESGSSYSEEKMLAFIQRWQPPRFTAVYAR